MSESFLYYAAARWGEGMDYGILRFRANGATPTYVWVTRYGQGSRGPEPEALDGEVLRPFTALTFPCA